MSHSQDTAIESINLPFAERRQARILATQCLYSMNFIPNSMKSIPEIIADVLTYGLTENESLDQEYFLNLINKTYNNIDSLRKHIQKYLAKNWEIKRLPEPIQAILTLAAYEIIYNPEVSVPIIINEYIEITRVFNHSGETGFINSVLDKISKEFPRG